MISIRTITVRLRSGHKRHAITEDSESPRATLCRRPADGAVIAADVPDCMTCLKAIARRSQR